MIRTSAARPTVDFSGTNPPYLTREAAEFVASAGFHHVLVTLPSVDREVRARFSLFVSVSRVVCSVCDMRPPVRARQDDGGHLVAHRLIFGVPLDAPVADVDASTLPLRTVTELCHVPETVADGVYLLNLQVSPMALDAAPSRPILYPILA